MGMRGLKSSVASLVDSTGRLTGKEFLQGKLADLPHLGSLLLLLPYPHPSSVCLSVPASRLSFCLPDSFSGLLTGFLTCLETEILPVLAITGSLLPVVVLHLGEKMNSVWGGGYASLPPCPFPAFLCLPSSLTSLVWFSFET